MSKITIAIPTHEMENREFFLRRSLDMLAKQTFKDFDIVISDNSNDKVLRDIAYLEYPDLDTMWYFNPKKGMAKNTNSAIKKSKGDLIKILYLDDYLFSENSLKEIVDNFSDACDWLITGCLHDSGDAKPLNPHYPSFERQDSDNYVGSPSVLTIKRGLKIYFDEKMTWLLDLDFYKRLYDKTGPPAFLHKLNVVIGIGKHQMTQILSDELKNNEREYINKKYVK